MEKKKAGAKASVKAKSDRKDKKEVWTGLPMALCLLLNHAT